MTASGGPEPDDARFMQLALALGRRGLGRTWPNPSVGALVVRHEPGGAHIVGRGWTSPGGRPHAETQALERAGPSARGATLYVTLEPCSHHGKTPPCADAIVAAGISRVVSAIDDPNPQVAGAGHQRLAAAGIALTIGPGADEARHDHAGHIRRMREGRPQVMLKLAVSADGKVGLAGRRPVTITGEPARQRVHLMRAMTDAILTGIGTVTSDDPLLTCRLPGMQDRSPVRVVLDSKLRLSSSSKLGASTREAPLWVVTGEDAERSREQALQALGIDVLRVPAAAGGIDLATTFKLLAARGITRVMVEAGPILAAALLRADLIDEAAFLRSTRSIGTEGLDALQDLPLAALVGSPRLVSTGEEHVGEDTIEWLARR